MDIATILGYILASGFVIWGMEFDFKTFLNVPSILIVVGGSFGLTLMSFPLSDTANFGRYAWYCVVPPKHGVDREKVISDLEKGIFMCKRIKEYAMACGWVGVLIGLVMALINLEDMAAVGPWVAVSLLSKLYGILIAFWFYIPIGTKLQVRLDEFTKAS